MRKLARLYLDTARLGLMSPSAQLAARDFARLAGEGVSTLYFQNLLRGRITFDRAPLAFPGLADWHGIAGLKARFRRLLKLSGSASVLFASRGASLMRWAARQLGRRCQRVLVPDTAWPPYVRILEEERLRRGGQMVFLPIRDQVLGGQIDARGLVARLIHAYVQHGCDGLFLAAVSHDGVRLPTATLLTALRRQTNVRFAVIDGAQELAHVPINLAATACDIWLAGAHKWLGGHQPLGIACLANSESAAYLQKSLAVESQHDDDPLLRFLLRLEGHNVRDVRETVNLAPLFSTWGALCDIPTQPASQAHRYRQRQENAALVGRLAASCGWQPVAVCPSLATGIAVLRARDLAIHRLPAEELETAIENSGVSLTALERGRLRLSLPAQPLNGEQWVQLERGLSIGQRDRFAPGPARARQPTCAPGR